MYYRVVVTFILAAIAQLAIPQSIDPSSIDSATKAQWCTDQKSSCPLICLQISSGQPEQNSCSSDSLSFSCVCSNGQTPNTANYSQTIPYYECTAAGTQCVNACPNGDTACQTSCRTAHPCGATNPKRVNVTSTSSMAAATTGDTGASGAAGGGKATGQNTFTGFGGSQATSSGNSAPGRTQAMAFSLGETFGLAVVLLSVSGGFFFML